MLRRYLAVFVFLQLVKLDFQRVFGIFVGALNIKSFKNKKE